MLTYSHPEAVGGFLKAFSLHRVTPCLELLSEVGRAFQKIPYENMTKLLRMRTVADPSIRLRFPDILLEEHLRFGTGGTCFSMTYFLQTVLRALGFNTYPIMADKLLAPNTHCASVIQLATAKYLLDPGFLINRPLPLSNRTSMNEINGTKMMIGPRDATSPNEYTLATITGETAKIRYFFKDRQVSDTEFLGFWQASFDWPSLRNISITAPTDGGYIYARNNFVRVWGKDGKKQSRIKTEIDTELGRTFNIDPKVIKEAFEVYAHIKNTSVIPANPSTTLRAGAGIQNSSKLDSRLRGNDKPVFIRGNDV